MEDSDDGSMVLRLIDSSATGDDVVGEEEAISISHLESCDINSILRSPIVQVRADRSRLIGQSSYFHALLGGSFSESHHEHAIIRWNLKVMIQVLQFMYGCSINVTSNNFLQLLEAALYFGVEKLFLECEAWLSQITTSRLQPVPLDILIEIWNFGLEHGVSFVTEQCKDYLARNFAWTTCQVSFSDIPYDFLTSCVEHPQLTVDSEKQLCEALLLWLSRNCGTLQCTTNDSKFDILKKVRINLLPLGFVAGFRRWIPQFADEIIDTLSSLIKDCSSSLLHATNNDNIDNFRIRLTENSEKIILSGCIHVTAPFLLISLLPPNMEGISINKMLHMCLKLDAHGADQFQFFEKSSRAMSFSGVREVDVSKCPKLRVSAIIKWLLMACPSLSILKASHCLQIKMEDVQYLIQKIPNINELDLTVDVTSLLPSKVSIKSTNSERYQQPNHARSEMTEDMLSLTIATSKMGATTLSSISKLTLEGRNDVHDMELARISALCGTLSYLNIKGCTLLTDVGISKFISQCFNIHSLVVSHTSFGKSSVQALCSGCIFSDGFPEVHYQISNTIAFRLQQLQVDSCKGIDQSCMSQLMSHSYMLNTLWLRETLLDDTALDKFQGSSLQSLDVSETMVSLQGLISVVRRNQSIRLLKATGCKNLCQPNIHNQISGSSFKDLLSEITRSRVLEDVAFGWGFSLIPLEICGILCTLKSITLGLGASPGLQFLFALPQICQLLESLILIFQVISDRVLRNILESLKNLRTLGLYSCLGNFTSSCFRINMPMLRILKLEWVASWMTNNDLDILTQNCLNLVELSLSGCKLLDSDSQQIISHGWPGLTFVHLEECGAITSNGVSSLFNCKAIEDLLLRHNGKGIGRNFIYDAVLKFPLLRKLALDLCDACEEGFESPSSDKRCFLSHVKISRCKSQTCGFDLQGAKAFRPVHRDTIVIEWNSKEMRTTIVKERL